MVNEGIELKQQITAWQNLIIFSEIVINFLRFIIIIFPFYHYKISRNNCLLFALHTQVDFSEDLYFQNR